MCVWLRSFIFASRPYPCSTAAACSSRSFAIFASKPEASAEAFAKSASFCFRATTCSCSNWLRLCEIYMSHIICPYLTAKLSELPKKIGYFCSTRLALHTTVRDSSFSSCKSFKFDSCCVVRSLNSLFNACLGLPKEGEHCESRRPF